MKKILLCGYLVACASTESVVTDATLDTSRADVGTADVGTADAIVADAQSDASRADDASADADVVSDSAIDSAVAVLGAPVLLSARLVVHGTMELAWRTPATTCQSIQVRRKVGSGAYAVAQTLAGAATSVRDMPGHSSGTFCYTLVCVANGSSSEPSNEMCVTQ